MHDAKPFIHWSYDPAINSQRCEIIEHLLRFIERGLLERGYPFKRHERFDEFENFVKAVMYEQCRHQMLKALTKKHYQDAGSTLDLLVKEFNKVRRWATFDGPVGAFHIGPLTDELQKRLDTIWPPNINEEEPTIEMAFEAAYSNFARANSRLVLMQVLLSLLQAKDPPQVWSVLREELWNRKAHFLADVMMFGGLAGGTLNATAVKLAANQRCYTDDSNNRFMLMHYLQVDAQSPGQWMSAAEEHLRSAIKAAYEAL
jgi:hypothetical protein